MTTVENLWVENLLSEVQYITITDKNGQRNAVQVDLDVWQEIISRLQMLEAPDEWDLAMEREESAYITLHPTLLPTHKGKHVAIYQGKMIDSDTDAVSLYERMQQQHPDQFVLITQVKEEPTETIHVHSNYSSYS